MTATEQKPSSEMVKARLEQERAEAAAVAARARVVELGRSDEAAVRATLNGELEAHHAACTAAFEDALPRIGKIAELVAQLNALDKGRRAGPPHTMAHIWDRRPTQVSIALPTGYRNLARALELALTPLEVSEGSPTQLAREVWALAAEVHYHGAPWDTPEFLGTHALLLKSDRTPSETLELKARLASMLSYGRREPKDKGDAA